MLLLSIFLAFFCFELGVNLAFVVSVCGVCVFCLLVWFFLLLFEVKIIVKKSGKSGRKSLLSGYLVSGLNVPRLVAIMFLIAFKKLIA